MIVCETGIGHNQVQILGFPVWPSKVKGSRLRPVGSLFYLTPDIHTVKLPYGQTRQHTSLWGRMLRIWLCPHVRKAARPTMASNLLRLLTTRRNCSQDGDAQSKQVAQIPISVWFTTRTPDKYMTVLPLSNSPEIERLIVRDRVGLCYG